LKTLVLGLGNTLLGDDGAGIYAIRQLEQKWPANDDEVEFVDGGTLSFTLTELIQDADQLIVIDAAQLNDKPGAVRVFEDQEMDHFVSNGKFASVHEVSLAELMDIARLTERLPERRALIGIQPQMVDWADKPTPEISAGIDIACNETQSLLEAWH
jgi:hydrogenase maturation protease